MLVRVWKAERKVHCLAKALLRLQQALLVLPLVLALPLMLLMFNKH